MRELENNPTKEYIRGLNITNISLPKIREKLVLYHFFRDMDKTSYKVKKIFSGGSRIVMKLLPFRKKPYLMVNGERLDVYQSSAYMCITMNLAKYIYNELKTNTKLTRYFKTAFAPDEMAIPTIIFNSPFKENCEYCKENRYDGLKTLSCITYFNYGKSVQVFKLSDYEELRNSGMMFARKFASGISDELMDKLDKEKVIQ